MTIGRKFGQHEPLTTRLHNLVRSYPKGLGVLKEFMQNADESGGDWGCQQSSPHLVLARAQHLTFDVLWTMEGFSP